MSPLTAVESIFDSIGSATKYETLIHTGIHGIARALNANTCSFMRYDTNKKVLKIDAAIGIDQQIVKNAMVRPGEHIAGWVLDHREPLLLVTKPARPGIRTLNPVAISVPPCPCRSRPNGKFLAF